MGIPLAVAVAAVPLAAAGPPSLLLLAAAAVPPVPLAVGGGARGSEPGRNACVFCFCWGVVDERAGRRECGAMDGCVKKGLTYHLHLGERLVAVRAEVADLVGVDAHHAEEQRAGDAQGHGGLGVPDGVCRSGVGMLYT